MKLLRIFTLFFLTCLTQSVNAQESKPKEYSWPSCFNSVCTTEDECQKLKSALVQIHKNSNDMKDANILSNDELFASRDEAFNAGKSGKSLSLEEFDAAKAEASPVPTEIIN